MTGDGPVFLDHQATTPCDPRVVAAMAPWLGRPANPHAAGNAHGRAAAAAVEAAREEVAALVGARPAEIVFTSGATEAANLALAGLAGSAGGHVVATAIEHACVLETAEALARAGVGTAVVPVGADGIADPDAVAAAIRPDTRVVAVMAANNEIGTVQPVAEVAALCARLGAPLFVDAAQAGATLALDVEALGVGLLSLSAHKMHGPPGIGALYVRRALAGRLAPLLHGGGQQHGLRPGTVPTALAVGFGAACAIARAEREADARRVAGLRDRMLGLLRAAIPDLALNGHPERRLPGNLSVRLPGVPADDLLEALPDLSLSAGSACASDRREPSRVLAAIGLGPVEAAETVRIGLGRTTTSGDVERAAGRIAEEAARLRRASSSVARRAAYL
jgi:cysteine desulfurase